MATFSRAMPLASRALTKATTRRAARPAKHVSTDRVVVAVIGGRHGAAITPPWPMSSPRAHRRGEGALTVTNALTEKEISDHTAAQRVNSGPGSDREPRDAESPDNALPDSAEARDKSPPESPLFAACAALAFAAIAFDVNSPMSLHLLQAPDLAVHNFVSTHASFEFRKYVADILISDAWLAASIIGWFVAGFRLFNVAPTAAFRRLGVGLGLSMVAAGGVSAHKDPWIVLSLKEAFHRIRPTTDLHHSFSFPSGHSNGAVFITGFLLFVLLMPVSRTSAQGTERVPFMELSTPSLVSIWIAAGLTTASGRMLADVHWLSDTMAGASLGALLVSLGALTVGQLEKMSTPRHETDRENTAP